MAAMRSPTVTDGTTFGADVAALRGTFPEIDSAVNDLREALTLGYTLPHIPLEAGQFPRVYVTAIDYPPLRAEGLGRFRVTYHATEPTSNPMSEPYRKYTLLTIQER